MITNYTLNWGDGTISTPTNDSFPLSHTYNAYGVFQLTLTATNSLGCTDSDTNTVINQTNPAIGIQGPPGGSTQGCAPMGYWFKLQNYSENSPGTIYVWNFGDGSPTTTWTTPIDIDSIFHEFTTSSCKLPSRQFIVSVKAINSCDSTTATVNNIKIFKKPIANFNTNPNPSCVGQSVKFTNTSTLAINIPNCNNITNYSWDFGDTTSGAQNTSTLDSPSHTYNTPGTYPVSLIAAGACSNDTITDTVCIVPIPIPAFTLDNSVGCAPLNVNATNTSNTLLSCSPSAFLWTVTYTPDFCANSSSCSFINETDSSSINPSFQFVNAGIYTITLSVSNQCDTLTTYKIVTVKDPPIVTLSTSPTSSCSNPASTTPIVNSTNCGTSPLTYLWTFTNGTPANSTNQIPGNISFSNVGSHKNSVSVTNECGTTTADTFFTIYPALTADAGSNMSICPGGSTILNGSASGVASPLSYSWTSIPTGFTSSLQTPTVSPSVTTTYYLTVTDINLCTSNSQVVVTVNPLPTVTVNSETICAGQTATLNASGADTYSWTPNTNISQTTGASVAATPSSTITYTIIGNDSTTGCSNTAMSTVTVNPLPTVTVNSETICRGQTATLNALGADTYSWTPNINISQITGASVTANPSATMDYTVTGTNTITGCSNTAISTVTVNNLPTVTVNSETICRGQTATLNALGADTYSWTPNINISQITGTSVTANPSATMDYTVTGINTTTGCSNTAISTVTVNPLPTVTVNSETICRGQTTTLNASGANTYSWTPNTNISQTTGASITVNPSVTTNYTVTGTDTTTGCSNTAMSIVTVNPLPNVDAGTDVSLCNQPIPYTLNGYSPANGIWTGNHVTSTGVFTPNGIGDFVLTYTFTNSNSCVNTDSITVTVVAPQIANAGTDFDICVDAPSYTITGFTPTGGTWSGTGVTGNSFNPTTAGVGTHTLTYSFGASTCLSTDDITVTVNPLPTVTVNSETICEGKTATLNALGADTYSWTPNTNISQTIGANVTANPSVTTDYTVTGTDTTTGCSNTAISTVTVNPLPNVDAGTDVSLCNQPIPYTLNGYSPANGIWTGNHVTSTGVFTPNGIGDFVLTYTFTNSNSCVNTDSITVTVVAPQIANAGTDFDICVDAPSYTITGFTPTGGTWSGTGVTGNSFNPTTAGVGTHTLTYSFGASTCLSTDDITVTVNPLPTVTVNSETICEGKTATLNALGADTYSWTPNTNISQTIGANVTANPSVTTDYTVTGTDTTTGCSNTAISTVTVNPLPNVDAGTDVSLCNHPIPYTLNGYSPSNGGTWSGSTNVTSTGVFTPNGIGNFVLTYTFTNSNSCVNTDSITVTVVAPQIANAGTDFDICVDAPSYTITGFTPTGGTWSGTGVTGNSFNPTTAGVGTHTLTYSFGASTCLSTDDITVTVNPLPTVTVNSETICEGKTATLNALGADTYSWTPNTNISQTIGANVTANPSVTTDYTVTGTDTTTGCSNTAISTVTVNPLPNVDAGTDVSLCNQPIPYTLNGYSPSNGGTWSGSTNVTSTGVFTPNGIGNFVLTYTFTNSNSCVNSDSITVAVMAPQIANAGADFDICVDAPSYTITRFTPTGGTWSGTGVTGNSFNPTTAGVGTHTLTYSFGASTCLSTDDITVTVNPLPTVTVNSETICRGQTTTLNASGANTYSWIPNTNISATTGASITASPSVTINYTVTGTDTTTRCSRIGV